MLIIMFASISFILNPAIITPVEFELQTDDAEDSETTDAVSPGTCLICAPFAGCRYIG